MGSWCWLPLCFAYCVLIPGLSLVFNNFQTLVIFVNLSRLVRFSSEQKHPEGQSSWFALVLLVLRSSWFEDVLLQQGPLLTHVWVVDLMKSRLRFTCVAVIFGHASRCPHHISYPIWWLRIYYRSRIWSSEIGKGFWWPVEFRLWIFLVSILQFFWASLLRRKVH